MDAIRRIEKGSAVLDELCGYIIDSSLFTSKKNYIGYPEVSSVVKGMKGERVYAGLDIVDCSRRINSETLWHLSMVAKPQEDDEQRMYIVFGYQDNRSFDHLRLMDFRAERTYRTLGLIAYTETGRSEVSRRIAQEDYVSGFVNSLMTDINRRFPKGKYTHLHRPKDYYYADPKVADSFY